MTIQSSKPLVHSHRFSCTTKMVDEWAWDRLADTFHFSESPGENGSSLLGGDVAACEHKRPHVGGLQCISFQFPVANALIASQNYPTIPACFSQPEFVDHASLKALSVPNYVCAGVSKSQCHRGAV